MAAIFQINLSSGELYTLAGLLHCQCLYGIENQTAKKWQTDLGRCIRQTVKRLENKKMILPELHGKLLIDPNIRTIIETLNKPNRIVMISGNAKNGKTTTMYVLEKNGSAVTVSKLDEDNYKLVIYPSNDIPKLLSNHFSVPESYGLHEQMLLEDVRYIKDKITSFQTDEAKSHLHKCLKNKDFIDFCFGVLDKKNDYKEIRLLAKKNDYYETTYASIVSCDQKGSAVVSIDENDVLTIDSFDEQKFNDITDRFFSEIKEGVCANG